MEVDKDEVNRHSDPKEDDRSSSRSRTKSKKIVGYVLFLLFGMGTWLNLNGIWIELPLLIPRLSEGWDLSPQLGMASNLANVGPLIIAFIRHLIGQSSAYEVPSICVIFAVGIIGPLVLSFTWFKQVSFYGKDRSIPLLVCGFFLALVNCTSSVTYLPFVNRFDSKWLNIYFAGESLSSLLPALLGLLQGVGHEPECILERNSTSLTTKLFPPRFSIQSYLFCLSLSMSISFVAFILLWRTQPRKRQATAPVSVLADELVRAELLTNENRDAIVVPADDTQVNRFDRRSLVYLVIILWTSILLIGCIPSINSYSLNPYGPATFHYVIILCQCCYPLISLISTLRPNLFIASTPGILLSTVGGTLAFAYIFITAYSSPCPPLIDEPMGKYLIGIIWIFVYLIFYYERISLGNYLNQTAGHRGLFWYGLLTQAGAFTGATFIFLLTWRDQFKERDFCQVYDC